MKKREADVKKASEDLLKLFADNGIRGTIDDSDKKPGDKYYHYEKLGVPIRIEVGPRDPSEYKELFFAPDGRHDGLLDEFRHQPQSWLVCVARA